MQRLPIVLTCVAVMCVVTDARAQSLQERIRIVREQQNNRTVERDQAEEVESLQIPRKMGKIIDEVFFDETPAEDVFNWWSQVTGVPLVIDFSGMELDGVDREQGITLNLQTVPAKVLLKAIMRQASPEGVDLIYEVTPWYVQVMTKRQANRDTVVRVYDIADMTMTIPNFTDAPSMDLNEALSNTGSGGSGSGSGGGGSSSGLFSNDDESDEKDSKTKQERGEELADLIMKTIEPTIWEVNGGTVGSARYYDGKLIVNAPMYVHRQIGIPVVTAYEPGSSGGYKSPAGGTDGTKASEPFGTQAD